MIGVYRQIQGAAAFGHGRLNAYDFSGEARTRHPFGQPAEISVFGFDGNDSSGIDPSGEAFGEKADIGADIDHPIAADVRPQRFNRAHLERGLVPLVGGVEKPAPHAPGQEPGRGHGAIQA